MEKEQPLKVRDALGRFLPGHPAWIHMVYRGSFPSRVQRMSKTIRTSLIEEKGGPGKCSIGDLILIDKLVSLLQVTFSMEKLVRQRGMFIEGKLDALLSDDYLAYCREVRNYLKDLNLSEKVANDLTLAEIIREHDEGTAKDKDQGAPEAKEDQQS